MIEVRAEIPAPASAIWDVLRNFGGVSAWNPFVDRADISGEGVGMSRTITARDGVRIVELLELLDDDERRLRYSVQVESGATSTADIRVEEEGAGRATVVWQSIRQAELTPEQEQAIVATLRSRIDALARAVSTT